MNNKICLDYQNLQKSCDKVNKNIPLRIISIDFVNFWGII